MIIQFKDRVREQEEIRRVLNSNKFEFLILYGRRRIGKTELILNTTKAKKRIYYLATGEKNLERFYNVCVQYNQKVSNLKKDYEVLFDFFKDNVDVIIIDEFQNMIKEDKNILNIFQILIDTTLKNSKLKLVLLGSSVSIITSKVLSYQSPLYGRRTASLKLKSVSFFDLKEFFPWATIDQLAEIYGFADGLPFYLLKINKAFWSWLYEELKQDKSFLRDEIDFLMRYEFEDPSTYKLILEALAHGKTKLNEIKEFMIAKRTDIMPYLKNLIEVDLIQREVPITDTIKSRNGRYYLKDHFLKFWFRYIYPHLSSIEIGIFDIEIIKRDYPSYLGFVFEDIIKQFIAQKKIFSVTKIGRWWWKDKEIDVVGLNEQANEIFFGECKWQSNVNAEKLLTSLQEKASVVDWKKDSRIEYYALFAKSFKEKTPHCKCYDLNDLKKALR